MSIVIQGLLLNACVTAVMAAILFLVQRARPLRHRPQLCHALWLLLLLKLFTPPVVAMNLPWPQWAKATPSFQISNDPFLQEVDPIEVDPIEVDPIEVDPIEVDPIEVDRVEVGPVDVNPVELDPVDQGVATTNVATMSGASNVASGSLLQNALVTIWLVGCVTLLLGGYVQNRRLSRLIRSTSSGSEGLQDAANSAAREFKLERVPDVRVVDAVVTPFLWAGAGGPLIVIPLRLLDALKPEDIRLVMKHELAHYVRRDHWSGATVSIACLLLWWNPLVWWIRRETRSLQEACCDQLVLESNGEDRHRYAEVLMATIDMVVGCETPDYRPATAFGDGRTLKRRIEMIVNNSIPAMRWQVLSAAVLIASALLLPLGIAFAQDDPVNASGQKALPFNTLPQDASDDEQQEGSSADHSSTVQGPSGFYESPRGRSVSRPPYLFWQGSNAARGESGKGEVESPNLELIKAKLEQLDWSGEASWDPEVGIVLDRYNLLSIELANEWDTEKERAMVAFLITAPFMKPGETSDKAVSWMTTYSRPLKDDAHALELLKSYLKLHGKKERELNSLTEWDTSDGELPDPFSRKKTLIAEPLIERGPQASVLGGLEPDEEILRLIEAYDKNPSMSRREAKEAWEKLLGLPKEKVREQLLLMLESDDLLIWKYYHFNPSNGSSSKNVYQTVLDLLLDRYGTKKDCAPIQRFLSRLLERDTEHYMFFVPAYCCKFLSKFPEDSSISVLVKALDHPGEFPLWFGEKLIQNRSIRGEALHALELIAGDEVSSYEVIEKTALTVEPKDMWIKEAKQWFSKLQ